MSGATTVSVSTSTYRQFSIRKVCDWLSAINPAEVEQENAKTKRSHYNIRDVILTAGEIRSSYRNYKLVLLTEMHPGKLRFEKLMKRMKELKVICCSFVIYAESYIETYRTIKDVERDNQFGNQFTMFSSVQGNRPRDGDIVWLYFAAYHEESLQPYSSSVSIYRARRGRPYRLEVGKNHEDRGLSMAVKWLPVGARGRFLVPNSVLRKRSKNEKRNNEPGLKILLLLHTVSHIEMHRSLDYLRENGFFNITMIGEGKGNYI